MTLPLSDVKALLDGWYDPATAEPWDAVGLVCGDPDQPVAKVLFAVDPAPAVVDEAEAWGADLVVVHHPLLLTAVHGVAATTPKGRVVHRLVRSGTALLTAHTNADLPADGVNESLAARGRHRRPAGVEAAPGRCPRSTSSWSSSRTTHADAVRAALAAAGAGVIGDYDSCTFTSTGEGRFRPLDGATPAIGRVGEVEVVPRSRVETVFARHLRRDVVAAMRAAHPYEELAYDVLELASVPGAQTPSRGHGPDRPAGGPDDAARVRRARRDGPARGPRTGSGSPATRTARSRPSWSAAAPATPCSTRCSAPAPTST